MKTNATSLPEAALLAPFVSVSLRDDVMTVPSVFDLFVIASKGWYFIALFINKSLYVKTHLP